ncbi:hypothetical protein [Streptomyces torulosus]|uniref:hypothetical protein n=1 Tax=Streptomyces torulosus TaxID=68276 RepID=UPI000A6B2314|nr:hypothetical protein [Streptomyces torulosus]
MEPGVGEYVHAVDVADLSFDLEESQIYERLSGIAANYRVEAPAVSVAGARLVPPET